MPRLEDYRDRYETIKMERTDGVLTITFHTQGGPLVWGATPHREFPRAFRDIASDSRNLVVIMTGTGTEFSGVRYPTHGTPGQTGSIKLDQYQRAVVSKEGKDLIMNLLSIEVPVIGVVNGPAWRHAEIPLLSDIVLAADNAAFQDSAHFVNGLPPGDGIQVVMPMVMGLTRARYFLLTGQVLTAADAERYGLVNEVLPRERLLDRAKELAAQLLKQPPVVLRHTRLILTEEAKRHMVHYMEYGRMLEVLASPKDSY